MRVWVYKINTKRGWRFDQYFHSRRKRPYAMGDEGWIRSAQSLRYLREEVECGDIFLCYETDRKRLVGAARAASDGRDVGQGSLIAFCPPQQAVRFENPLRRHHDLDHILAFTPQRGRGTVQRIESDEFSRLKAILLRKNPAQAPRLRRWLDESPGTGRGHLWKRARGGRRFKGTSPELRVTVAMRPPDGRKMEQRLPAEFLAPAAGRSRQSDKQ